MDTRILKRAREMWCLDYIPYCQQRHNMREWVRAIRIVRDGGNWLLLKQVQRKEVVT